MIRAVALAALLAVAACGVDGPPRPPAEPPAEPPERGAEAPRSGIAITGSAAIGVTGGG
jgi:predicted small lipoprotein YifL